MMENKCIKDLTKLFVWVPASAGTSFVGSSTEGSQQVYFEEGTGKIWVNGKAFGVSSDAAADITELKAILAGFKKGDGSPANETLKTVADALATLKSELLGAYEGSETPETIKGLDTRIKAVEILVEADTDGVVNKLEEIIDWFNNLPEDSKLATELVADVAANKEAIGEKAVLYKEGDEIPEGKQVGDVKTEATGLYKEIEDAIASANSAIEDLDVAETTVGTGNVKVTYSETDGKVNISAVAVDETAGTFTAATETAPANLSVAEGDATKLLNAGAIAAIKDYVDAVAAANQEGITIAEGSKAYLGVDSTDDHKISAKTVTLASTVGMTKNTDGTWVAGTAADQVNGLATAADVAAEIVADEQVIAAALNDHESRIATVENFQIWTVWTDAE